MPMGLAGAMGAAGKGALTPAIRHSKLGRPSGGGGKSPKRRKTSRAIIAIILVIGLIAGGYTAILQGLFGVLNNDDGTPAGTYTTITLNVQAMDSANNPVKDVTVDLKPTKKNTTGSEIKMPATGEDGTANTVIGSSGGAFDAPTNGKSYYFSCSAYNPTRKQRANPQPEKPECAGVVGGDSTLLCQPGVIAADPFLIPHGTIVYIQGVDAKTLQPNGFVYGYAEAADTGDFLTKAYNNAGTSSAAKGPSFLGKPAQGVHDVYNKKTYKRGVDMWYNTVGEARHVGTKLCKVTIVSATQPGCMNGARYIGGVSSGNGAYEKQASKARLSQARGGVTTEDGGGVTASYGEFTVTSTGGLTCGDADADKTLDVDALVQSPGTKTEIKVPGGILTFWVDIDADDDGTGAGSTNYLAWAKKLADNPRVGYHLGSNHGSTFQANSDVDCSSLVYWSLKKTGYLSKETGCFSTPGEPSVLLRNGFKQIPMSQVKPGDILWKKGHTEIYVGGKSYSFGAHRNIDGKSGKGGNGGHSNSTAVTEVGYAAGKQNFTLAFRAPS